MQATSNAARRDASAAAHADLILARVLSLALAVWSGGCSAPPDPISIEGGTITIENQTPREWRNVLITVNDHFRGGAPSLAPRGRLNAPLSQFQTAYGQRFRPASQPVVTIEVSATDENGDPVALAWGTRQK